MAAAAAEQTNTGLVMFLAGFAVAFLVLPDLIPS